MRVSIAARVVQEPLLSVRVSRAAPRGTEVKSSIIRAPARTRTCDPRLSHAGWVRESAGECRLADFSEKTPAQSAGECSHGADGDDCRTITGPLYGGDQEFRVRQEIMLGIGRVAPSRKSPSNAASR
jgi:hypothetical protein